MPENMTEKHSLHNNKGKIKIYISVLQTHTIRESVSIRTMVSHYTGRSGLPHISEVITDIYRAVVEWQLKTEN
jgi:hypothetical protein